MNATTHIALVGCLTGILLISGCTSMKTPATSNIAVSKNAVDSAAAAGAGRYAPEELQSARDKLASANKAMADDNYQQANDLAIASQADAKVAQNKASAAKAQTAADALSTSNTVLTDELSRKNSQ